MSFWSEYSKTFQKQSLCRAKFTVESVCTAERKFRQKFRQEKWSIVPEQESAGWRLKDTLCPTATNGNYLAENYQIETI